MKKKIPLVLGLLIIGALGTFWWLRQPARPGKGLLGGKTPTTFAELMSAGQSYTCTYEIADEAGTNSGTIYVADQATKFRGDFLITMADGTQEPSHMIRNDNYSYMWSSADQQGMKIKFNEEDAQTALEDAQAEKPEGYDFDEMGIDEQMNLNCQPWKVDNSLFTPPSNIDFIDYADQMKTMINKMNGETLELPTDDTAGDTTNDTEPDCSVCDQVPAGDARDACLTSLGC